MSSLPACFIASLPEFPSLGESLRFQLTGLAVVFIALGSIWAVMEIAGAWFKRHPQPVASAPAAPTVAPADAAIDPATLAIIAAAVHVTVGGPHRIHAITAADHPVDWAREGRRHHFASHQVR
jgi:Na+-transporting methylmalonyl-CoA/oxaloacetate decarboxylase gamma subunit